MDSSHNVHTLIRMSFQPGANDHDDNPVDWVEASCRIASQAWIVPPHRVPGFYARKAVPVIGNQLIAGGLHLADTLNRLLP
jgi:hypothetical protein